MNGRRGPRPTGERLRRLLVMLPWLMERGEVAVAEMAHRFSVSEAELVHDLELAAMCGLPPFVDEMIDVFIDEGTVFTGVPRVFTRPLRLTAPEGFALLAAARVAMQLPGADVDGALARALAKLAAALGDDAVVVDSPAPPLAAELAAAIDDGARLRIGYQSATAETSTARDVSPRRLFVDRGHWYLIADDCLAGEQRTFRVDRIEGCDRTGDIDSPRDVEVPTNDTWFVGADLPSVRLRLDRASTWVVERYPTRGVTDDGDGVVVELTVANETWLRDLLLRLGAGAVVLDPPEWRTVGADAARRLLARYEAGGSAES